MRIREVAVSSWMILLLGLLTCFAQAAPDRRQQIELHSRKAAEYLKANKPELAEQEFKAIIAIDPNNVEAHSNLGAVFFFQGDYAAAIPQLRAALKLKPALWKTQALLGFAEKQTGDSASAQRELESAFPNLTEKKIQIQAGTQLIDLYSANGDLDKAAGIVGVLRKLEPTDPTILYSAYRLYSDLGDEALLSLSIVDPKSARMNQAMAHELAKRGNTAEAIEHYRAAIKLDPTLPGIHFELAEMLNILGTAEGRTEAESEYKAALEANPGDEQSERRIGEIAAQANDLKSAADHYTRALQLQPRDPEACVGLAKVDMALDQSEKAEALLKRAIQLDPTSVVAHFRLSTIYRQTGRPTEAKHELDEYQKYKGMKEKLREVYHDLHRDLSLSVSDDTDSSK